MNTFLYVVLAVMGTIFGSFFTLAVYRIPRKENIVYVRSHCTTCNHKLNFWDLIPVLSYIFLGGKCRYCKESIRPRYLILELLSGAMFVLMALALNINIYSTITDFITYAYCILIISTLCILMGIGKNINLSVVIFGMIVRTIYLIFFDTINFNQFFIQTSLFIIVALIMYLCISKYLNAKHNDKKYFDTKYIFVPQTILFVALLIYVFGSSITISIMLLGLLVLNIFKLILKKSIDNIMCISFISILMLILTNSSLI